jgi:hypothetical protein
MTNLMESVVADWIANEMSRETELTVIRRRAIVLPMTR